MRVVRSRTLLEIGLEDEATRSPLRDRDPELVALCKRLLEDTRRSARAPVVRWRLKNCLTALATEFGVGQKPLPAKPPSGKSNHRVRQAQG